MTYRKQLIKYLEKLPVSPPVFNVIRSPHDEFRLTLEIAFPIQHPSNIDDPLYKLVIDSLFERFDHNRKKICIDQEKTVANALSTARTAVKDFIYKRCGKNSFKSSIYRWWYDRMWYHNMDEIILGLYDYIQRNCANEAHLNNAWNLMKAIKEKNAKK